jgi:glycosyltransferase involved in cell wall biosynthesis
VRLLFVTLDVPRDGGSGLQIVSRRLLEAYATFAEIDVLAFVPPGSHAPAALRELASRLELVPVKGFHLATAPLTAAARLARAQLGAQPYAVRKYVRRSAYADVLRWGAERGYDLLHCDSLSATGYRAAAASTPAILLEHNVEWELVARRAEHAGHGPKGAMLRREARRTERYERAAVRSFGHVLTLSERDRGLLVGGDPALAGKVSVWPLPARGDGPPLPTPPQPLRLLVLGSLRSLGRADGLRWFLREIWPQLRQRHPDAQLDVAGAAPPADIAARDSGDGVRIHGFVDDLEPLLARAHACAIPLFVGGGIRVKVIELLARGVPCIGTDVGLQGVETLAGCRLARDPDEWLDAVEQTALARLRDAAAASAHAFAATRSPRHAADELRRAAEAVLA